MSHQDHFQEMKEQGANSLSLNDSKLIESVSPVPFNLASTFLSSNLSFVISISLSFAPSSNLCLSTVSLRS